jgi:uncharacterized protein
MSFANPSQDRIRALLAAARTVAVVGFSPNIMRPSHRIARGLQSVGYCIIPVRPGIDAGLGEQAYPALGAVPHPIDIVDVFRAPVHVPAIVDECLRLGLPALWLQDGVIHEAAALRACAGGMTVVMDRCLLRDHYSLRA